MQRDRSFQELIKDCVEDAREAKLRADESAGRARRLANFAEVLKTAEMVFGGPGGLLRAIAAAPKSECGCCKTDRPVITIADGIRHMICDGCTRAEKLEPGAPLVKAEIRPVMGDATN